MVEGGSLINKKIFALAAFLLAFAVLASNAYADTAGSTSTSGISLFDVSIDRVRVNGNVISESRSNLINDADVFSVAVDFTAIQTLEKGRIEAILSGRQTGSVVSDSTGTFDLARNRSSTAALNLVLIDNLKRETDFDLTIKIADARSRSEQKRFGIRTEAVARARGALDVSIDRVQVNNKVVAQSKTNFIDESDDFNVLVEFTALENLEDAHIETVLKDLRSGFVIADASPNFNLFEDSSTSKLLKLKLLNQLKKSNSLELTVKIIDAEGNFVQKTFGIRMRDGDGAAIDGRVLDVSINSVEVEDKIVAESENNFVIIGESKKELDIKVRLTSLEDIEDARIEAILVFENGDVVADITTVFDIKDGESVVKKLELPLISNFEQNRFRLKLKVIDSEGDFEEKEYGLKISKQKFPFVVSSISLSPESNAEAGKNLVVTLRFKNSGVVPLEGVNARVSIPELGISSTKFIDTIKNSDKSEVKEEFVLKLLDNAQTGTYTVRAEISSQFDSDKEVKEVSVFVLGKDAQSKQIVNDKLIINVPVVKQDVYEGREVIYPITLKNEGPDANSYTLLFDGADWASIRLSESNIFVIRPKESKTINIFVSSKGNVIGEQAFSAIIKSNEQVLSQIQLKGNVIPAKGALTAKLKDVLQTGLIALAVLLAVAGLFLGIKRYAQGENLSDEPEEIEPYY